MSLPLISATRKAQNWCEVLALYSRSFKAMKGIYVPNTFEIVHGVQLMATSWSLSLFYYTLLKENSNRNINNAIATAVLQKYRHLGNFSGMKRIFDEDIHSVSTTAAYSTLLLASCNGMWEKSLEIYQSNPKLSKNISARKSVVKSLCLHNKWETALITILRDQFVDSTPSLIRPVIKSLSNQHLHHQALRLAASSFSAGYTLNTELFSALAMSMKYTGNWQAALFSAQKLRLLSSQNSVQNFHLGLYNSIVDFLYQADLYYPFSVADIVADVSERLKPKYSHVCSPPASKHFRLLTFHDVQQQYFPIIHSLNNVYVKLIKIPLWYRKGLQGIVESIFSGSNLGVVLDTNFVMQCISKNLSFEHFIPSILMQRAELKHLKFNVIVVPFTAIQELYHLIWDAHSRVRKSVKVLLWSRLMVFLRRPEIVCLSFSAEFPCSSLSILSQMAYAKSNKSLSTSFSSNPDARILNTCITLQHYVRCKEISVSQGSCPAEGIMLFSLLKYHVRRFNNTTKGPATNKLLLCTLDKNLSEAATEAGVMCFPNLSK